MGTNQVYDYIVVGAGSAGCVLASRLISNASARVLLLEAGGPDTKPEIHDPSGLLALWGSDVDWNYTTVPQPGLFGRRVAIARGKVLGGSSAINAMIYVRGNRRDFDHWNQLGNEGWSYDDVLPYFRKSENYAGGGSEYHGTNGPLSIVEHPNPTAVATAFANAGPDLGWGGPDWDFNGKQQENGTGLYQYTLTRDGKRCSTATAFLDPVRDRPNLTIDTGSQAVRVAIEGHRAVGVNYVHAGASRVARAEREIIVCAGTFDSPRLLLLSGIGPAEPLRSLGIPLVADLPGVGENLQDHILLPVFYTSKQELPVPQFIAEAGLFVRTRDGLDAASPDLQFHFSAGIPAFIPPDYSVPGPNFAFVPILVQPQSRGTVSLRSADPLDAAIIQPNYLQCDADVDVLVKGIQLSRAIAATRAFRGITDAEVSPGRDASDLELRTFIRSHCSTVWHVAGTCRMGRDRLAVVDPQLRVHGVGLRVADASVMPSITSGNTNAACIMIGEKAADLILADHA